LSFVVALAVTCRPKAKSPEALSRKADEGILSLARYATDHRGKRPSVLALVVPTVLVSTFRHTNAIILILVYSPRWISGA
jgi:hypothetical protein